MHALNKQIEELKKNNLTKIRLIQKQYNPIIFTKKKPENLELYQNFW